MPVSDSVPDLSWLADAPIFIDSKQIGVFYDAVVGPAFRTVELQVTATQTQQLEKSGAGRLGSGLSALFPWLKIDAGLEARRTATKSRARRPGHHLAADRQRCPAARAALAALPGDQPDRICVVGPGDPRPGAEAITASPRMIAFIDVLPSFRTGARHARADDG